MILIHNRKYIYIILFLYSHVKTNIDLYFSSTILYIYIYILILYLIYFIIENISIKFYKNMLYLKFIIKTSICTALYYVRKNVFLSISGYQKVTSKI